MSYRPFRRRASITAAVLACLAWASAALAGPGVPETKTLANGLKIVVLEDHTLPLVSVSLWVHAGSKDEIETSAGYAHYLEHLMQRGTDTSGPFEYQRLSHRWGGSLTVRAGYDRTYITATGVPSVLDQMVDAVAAMALRAKLDGKEIDQEMVPLTQEVRRYYDEPSSVAFLESVRAAFPKHPYRFPPLGNLKAVGGLKHEALAAFYSNLYVPNNMALVLAGDLEPARARELAERFFGKATKSSTLPTKPAPPSGFAGHDDKEKPLDLKEAWTTLTFVGPGYRHPDRPAFEILARALGEAGGSRILAALARDKTGTSAQVTFYRLEDAGLLYIGMKPSAPELSYAAASAALGEIAALKKRGLQGEEVKALVQGQLKDARLEAERIDSLTESLGEAALLGGTRYYWDLPDQLGRLDAAAVNRVAAKYLVAENLRLVVILPRATPSFTDERKEDFHKALDSLGGMVKDAPPVDFDKRLYAEEDASRVRPDAWGNPRDAAASRPPQRSTLDNGLALVIQEDHRRPLAAVSLYLAFGSADDPPGREGLAYVAGRFLSPAPTYPGRGDVLRAGDKTVVLPEIQVTRDLTEARFLTSPADLRSGLVALASQVRKPEVSDTAFEGVRKGTREALDRAAADPSFVALELFREKVYAGHAYAHPAVGTSSGLTALTRADVEAFLKRGFRPEGAALAITGDVNSSDIQKWVRELFGAWKGESEKTGGSPRGRYARRETTASLASAEPGTKGADAALAPATSGSSAEAVTPLSRNPANAGASPGEFTRLLSLPQSSVLVGVPGAAIGDADFDDLRILGAGLTILSFEELIFKRRAAFTATAVPEALREGGAFALVVVAQNARRDEAVFEVQRQMRHLALEGVEQKDLDDFARVEAGREASALQGVLPAASALAYGAAAGLPPGSHRPGGSPQRLKDLATRFLGPGSWIVITVGPPSP